VIWLNDLSSFGLRRKEITRKMLRFVVCALLVAGCFAQSGCGKSSPWTPGEQTVVTVQRPEGPRYFIVYVPSTYNASMSSGLQFVWHGLNDNCYNFINATGFIPLAEAEGYILVAPCATIGLIGIAWNSGTCCGFLDEEHPNDMQFGRQIASTIKESLCINDEKVVTSGFSNGAFMSEVLGCESPDIFRGVVSVSGVVELRPGNDAAIARCSANITVSTKRPSVLLIHGDFDFVVPWTGDFLLGFPTVPDNAAGWTQRNGCTGNATQTLNIPDYTNQVWGSCNGWSQKPGSVELVRHHGGGHEWPEDQFDTTGYIHNWTMRLWNQ
jgi:poly(3-hydroxybutyrate) depolymerase